MNRLVIVDGNNIAHAAFHAHSRLSYKGFVVSMIYGVPNMVRSYIEFMKPDKLIVVWDGDRNKERKKILPDYKGHRDRKRLIDIENFIQQKDTCKKLLYFLGVSQVHNTDQEADDMIYKVVKKARTSKRFDKVTIVSSDKDFHQLITQNYHIDIEVYHHLKKKTLNKGNLKELYGYHPDQTVDYLTMIGDKSDNIPGLQGIGEVKAKRILERYTLVELSELNDIPYKIDREVLLETIQRSRILIDLRYFDQYYNKDVKIQWYEGQKRPKIQPDAFYMVCTKYGLRKFMGKSFIKPFKKL